MDNRIIIVGFGPAGIACAIQLKRMGIDPLVIEKDKPGGMLYNANLIENYPGFPKGIPGDKLATLLKKQASFFKINLLKDNILDVNYKEGIFHLKGMASDYSCEVLVIASGTTPVIPENFHSDLFVKGLIHFDVSELRKTSGKTIGIIGAGDAAFDYSLTLAEQGNNVLIFNRGSRIKALKTLKEKVFINNRIKYLENTVVEILETQAGQGLQAIGSGASLNKKFSLDYLIFATGRNPALGMLGENITKNLRTLQDKHRLYLAGDVNNGTFRQVSVAVGDGVKTAMEIFQHESNQQNRE